jgi:ATP phosphoribosyltransferase
MTVMTLALPKQEKLKKAVLPLLAKAGFNLETYDGLDQGRLTDCRAGLPPIAVEFARAADAVMFLERGIVDAAIIGSDVVDDLRYESGGTGPTLTQRFSAAACRICLAAPSDLASWYQGDLSRLSGMRIATSYPGILQSWLGQSGIVPAEIVTLDGGVEMSIRRGLADVVMDLVETGSTLRKNGLTIIRDITRSSAGLYAVNPGKGSLRDIAQRLKQADSDLPPMSEAPLSGGIVAGRNFGKGCGGAFAFG